MVGAYHVESVRRPDILDRFTTEIPSQRCVEVDVLLDLLLALVAAGRQCVQREKPRGVFGGLQFEIQSSAFSDVTLAEDGMMDNLATPISRVEVYAEDHAVVLVYGIVGAHKVLSGFLVSTPADNLSADD